MYVISVALVHGDRDDREGEAAPDRRYLERLRQAKSGLSTPGPEDTERERDRERDRERQRPPPPLPLPITAASTAA